MDLTHPSLYTNRELSVLEFNRRVLQVAADPATPLLERLRLLTICSTNLDEFFEVRVSSLKEQIAFNLPQMGPDGVGSQDALRAIREAAHALVRTQYALLREELL